ncbi:MAG: hypothetical protein ABI729_09645 [Chitinophagales bacterium]
MIGLLTDLLQVGLKLKKPLEFLQKAFLIGALWHPEQREGTFSKVSKYFT